MCAYCVRRAYVTVYYNACVHECVQSHGQDTLTVVMYVVKV